MIETIRKYSYDIFKMLLNQAGIAMLGLVMTMSTFQNDKLYFLTSIACIFFYLYLIYTMTYELGQKDKPAIDGARAEFIPLKGLWVSLGANAINIICGIMVAVFSFFIVMQSPVEIVDANGNDIKVYTRSQLSDQQNATDTLEAPVEYSYTPVSLFSDNGGRVVTAEYNGCRYTEVVDTKGAVQLLYDENGNELDLYSDSGMKVSTAQNSVKNWASNLYAVPYMIATFFQSMFVGVKETLFGSNDFFFLFTPIPALVFSGIGYYFGVKGKRIFFFLPERKQKPPKHLR